MNKFITTDTGGLPYVLDDIRWVEDSNREGISDIVKGIVDSGTTDFILWGCNITDNTTTFDVSEGAIVFDGEIYHLAATTGLTKVALQYLIFRPSTGTYDSDGLKTFQDAATHDTYEIRIATATIGAIPGAGSYIIASTQGASAIPEKRDQTFNNYIGSPTKISLGATSIDDTGTYNSGGTIIAATTPFKFWKRGRMVECEGGFAYTGGFTPIVTTLLGTLPAGYRPNSKIMMNGYSYGSDSWCPIEINTSGEIYLRADLHNTMMGAGCTINATTGVILNGSFAI